MLDSVKIARRQSEIRQQLASLVGKETPTEDETSRWSRSTASIAPTKPATAPR